MEGLEVTVLLGLTILAGALLAPRIRVALPLVLVVFGLLLGFVPSLREVQLPPETVLLLFLPVMLFWESLTTSLRSIRRDFRYILPMSTLLVVASAFAVAGVGVLLGMPWEIALILGAAVAPFIAVYLWQQADGSVWLVGLYLSAMALFTLFALIISRETRDIDYNSNVE